VRRERTPSLVRWQRTTAASVNVRSDMADLFALLATDVATEGKDIVLSMLVVGLIFIGVIAVGQLVRWLAHR
jgi:hypothetical protein